MGNPLFPAVVVNGFEISSDAIATEAQNHKAPKGKPGLAWRLAARALVIRELLLQEARKRDLQPQPIELEPGKIETDEEAMIREVLDDPRGSGSGRQAQCADRGKHEKGLCRAPGYVPFADIV